MLDYRTKGNAEPRGKRKVYFTCHPEDMARYFDKICEDIFKTHDCAIYYTSDMNEEHDENRDVDLGSMNLFVVPVTFRLLTQPCRAMDEDIAFAKKNNIPILPFMMESDIDEFYSREEKFGERQYLNPYSRDLSEISYEEKLKKYLESVLISDEMVKRIRAAFDAYIFLSYRKKDRRYANELMRLIHSRPECRDIAIWYDEFLTPGESFKENIKKILSDSKLFALLVTPSLLEEPDGKPNYIMEHEYPDARRAKLKIFPAEMEKTDRKALRKKFKRLPKCTDPHNDEEFKKRFVDSVLKIDVVENDKDPEHNFLIGLAYLDGIDVEVDRKRAIELITGAAEAGLPEAMKKLYTMYNEGVAVKLDYREALKLAEMLVEYYIDEDGRVLQWMKNVGYMYFCLGEYRKALDAYEKTYTRSCKAYGEENAFSLCTLTEIAYSLLQLGEYSKAKDTLEKVYSLQCRICGEEHDGTLLTLNRLALTYSELGCYEKAKEIDAKLYSVYLRIKGEYSSKTLTELANLGSNYILLGDYNKAKELLEKAYIMECRVFGEDNLKTVSTKHELALTYSHLYDYNKAKELNEQVYKVRCSLLGEEHPVTLTTLGNLALDYSQFGDYKKAGELHERVYLTRCRILGEEHPDTLTSLHMLANHYRDNGEYKTAKELFEKTYTLRKRILGEEHPRTLLSYACYAECLSDFGQHENAKTLLESIYPAFCDAWGKDHSHTHTLGMKIVKQYFALGEYEKGKKIAQTAYDFHCNLHGEKHIDMINIFWLYAIARAYYHLDDLDKSEEFMKKVYNGLIELGMRESDMALESLGLLLGIYSKREDNAKITEVAEKMRDIIAKKHAEDHTAELEVLKALFSVYYALDMLVKAREVAEKIHCELERPEIKDTKYRMFVLDSLVEVYTDLKDYAKVAEYAKYLYDIQRLTYGEEHTDTLSTLSKLSFACLKVNMYTEASEYYGMLYNAYSNTDNLKKLSLVLHNWAYCHSMLGNVEKAVEFYEKSYTIRCQIPDIPLDVRIKTLYRLCESYYRVGRYSEATEGFEKVYEFRLSNLGEDHPDTVEALKNLEAAREKSGKQ